MSLPPLSSHSYCTYLDWHVAQGIAIARLRLPPGSGVLLPDYFLTGLEPMCVAGLMLSQAVTPAFAHHWLLGCPAGSAAPSVQDLMGLIHPTCSAGRGSPGCPGVALACDVGQAEFPATRCQCCLSYGEMAGVPPASPGADRAGRSEELTELELTLLPSHTDQRKVNYRVTSEAHQREGTEQGQVSGWSQAACGVGDGL